MKIDGQSPTQARKAGGQMTYMFQEPTLLPWRSVLDNVELPMELQARGRFRKRYEGNTLRDNLGVTFEPPTYSVPDRYSGTRVPAELRDSSLAAAR